MNLEINKVMQLKSRIIFIAFITAVIFTFTNCSSDDETNAQSMSEIQKANGIPVTLQELKQEYFEKELTYYSRLTGIKQTIRSSAVGGRIEKINYKVGDFVKKDAVVVQFPEDSPSVQYEQAKAAYENSKKTYERMKTLLDAGETSQANFDGAETKYLVDKRNYEMARQALFIDAPYAGVIVEIMVNEGDGVDSKEPLFTIARLNKMKAKIWASEDEIQQIEKGMPAETTVNGKQIIGKVTEIAMAVDPRRRAYYAEVEFDNPNNELNPGMSSEISIKVYENKDAIVIPRNLIQKNEEGKYVFVAKDGKAEFRKIKTGRENGLSVEILSGLAAGDQLIVKGAEQVENGQKLNVVQ